jgi:hypothetical protein
LVPGKFKSALLRWEEGGRARPQLAVNSSTWPFARPGPDNSDVLPEDQQVHGELHHKYK